ncbi:hypothetical protein B5X24_HaOG200523 [Helicoverpa armigera]|nr:hypothetical protein B5X24_HaOG200523 [Helicoverpa armigera]
MLKLPVLLLLLCYKSESGKTTKKAPWPRQVTPKLRIHHAQDAETAAYPFIAMLITIPEPKTSFLRHCTSSIITKNYALTAAHCLTIRSTSPLYVWHGSHAVSPLETESYTAVTEYFPHPTSRGPLAEGPSFRTFLNDVGLVRFNDVTLPRYGILSAVDYLTMIGLPVKYVGGGRTSKPDDDNKRALQVGEGAILSCPSEFKKTSSIIICVVPKCVSSLSPVAQGDSGGPLLENGKIIGVVATSISHNSSNVCTPISPYLDWIYSILNSI